MTELRPYRLNFYYTAAVAEGDDVADLIVKLDEFAESIGLLPELSGAQLMPPVDVIADSPLAQRLAA